MPALRDPIAVVQLDIHDELAEVEAVLREAAGSDQELVHEAGQHLIRAGGKRFRPMLTLLCGYLGDPADPRIVRCAAAIELTHLATLYHDDVIDETTLRRGVPTVNATFGNHIAVLAGDFLLARSSSLAADLGAYVSRRLADTIAELCEGQIMETGGAGSLDVAPDRYLDVIKRKTASLIATACHLGAYLAGAEPHLVEAATSYGLALGMAFQLSDDLLDITGVEEDSGKTPGTDLREGVLTLPALLTLEGRAPGGDTLRDALQRKDVNASLELLRGNGALDLARAAVSDWQRRALAALEPVAAGEARGALERLVGFVGDRDS
jgi:heptaprenyl diphosphate synthase